jgi:putative restriction endonuclease
MSPCNKGNREIAIAFRPDFLVEYIRFLEPLHDTGKSPVDFEVLTSVATDPGKIRDDDMNKVTLPRRTAIASVRRALRDNSFKERVLTAYSHKCSACSLQMDLVEAAHIIPVSVQDSTDETCNGLALCALHHRAYDRALITIDDHYHVLISESEKGRLKEIKHDGGMESFIQSIRPLILLPPAESDRPNVRYLTLGREVRHWTG